MYKVLHFTPHMGGGVGNIISHITSAQKQYISHMVILLEQPKDEHFIHITKEKGVRVLICPDCTLLSKIVSESDIVIIHWWHHPKTSLLLYNFPEIPVRLVIWSHISNLTVPSLAPDFITESTRVLFTTEASIEAWNYRLMDKSVLISKAGIVPGCGGIDSDYIPNHNKHIGFRIGYLGYVDFSKIHHDFIAFCKAVNIPKAEFTLAGNAPARLVLEDQARVHNLTNSLNFLGYITDINNVFAEWDVFGYPLMPMHTCTTENTIIEAMAAEVPPVLLNQLTERYIIKNMETGLLASGMEEYGNAIRYLYENPDQRIRIGRNARKFVIEKYAFDKILNQFIENCDLVMCDIKKIVNFRQFLGNTPAEWFISCLGEQKTIFYRSYLNIRNDQKVVMDNEILQCSPLLKLERKSSVLHYAEEFPEDPILAKWASTIKEDKKSAE